MEFLAVIILITLFFVLYFKITIKKLKLEHDKDVKEKMQWAREDALKKSRSTIGGNVTETLAPLIPGFPYNGRDCKQYGSPFDYICVDGMSECRDSNGEIDVREIIFIDIKTGNSQLTLVEKRIKQAIEEGRVKWVTLRMDFERGGLVPVKHRKKSHIPTVREQEFSDRLDTLEENGLDTESNNE